MIMNQYILPSSNNETMLLPQINESNRENLDSNHEQEAPSFGPFSSPFLEEILHNQHQHIPINTANKPPPSPSKPKRARKQRSTGKKDRHSKIHTAQGLRDRRMRLSLHIARKFFGLQDMLGFDKASKTIEWLFCKSKKAIEEVTKSVQSQNTTQTTSCESPNCEADLEIEIAAGSKKGKQLKVVHDDHEINDGVNATNTDALARGLRGKARERARERTRERLLINNHMFGANPSDNYDQMQLGFSSNPNNQYIQDSSSSPNEYYSGALHFFDHTQLNDQIARKTDDYLGTVVPSSSTYLANPPAGWLNSSNMFLGLLGGNWDSENLTENYEVLPNLDPLAGDFMHFQTQNQRD